MSPTRELVAIARTEDIPPMEGRTVTLDGRRIALFHTATGFHAIDAACPHKGGPLEEGLLGDSSVACPLHGLRIDLKTGCALAGGEGSVAVHQVVVRDGWVYIEPPL